MDINISHQLPIVFSSTGNYGAISGTVNHKGKPYVIRIDFFAYRTPKVFVNGLIYDRKLPYIYYTFNQRAESLGWLRRIGDKTNETQANII